MNLPQDIDLHDKGKIIDLWRRVRSNNKHRSHINLLKRSLLIAVFLGFCVLLFELTTHLQYSKNHERLHITDLMNSTDPAIGENLSFKDDGDLWLIRKDFRAMKDEIKHTDPLIDRVYIKPSLFPGSPRIEVQIAKDYPWARFSNGWILTSSSRVVRDEKSLSLHDSSFASQTIIDLPPNIDYMHKAQAEVLQRLILIANKQLPEAQLERLIWRENGTIQLSYDSLTVELGEADAEIFRRVGHISDLLPLLRKYGGKVDKLDLSFSQKAIIKLKPQ